MHTALMSESDRNAYKYTWDRRLKSALRSTIKASKVPCSRAQRASRAQADLGGFEPVILQFTVQRLTARPCYPLKSMLHPSEEIMQYITRTRASLIYAYEIESEIPLLTPSDWQFPHSQQ